MATKCPIIVRAHARRAELTAAYYATRRAALYQKRSCNSTTLPAGTLEMYPLNPHQLLDNEERAPALRHSNTPPAGTLEQCTFILTAARI